ncbi:MAG: hypothetical protein LBG93_05605 [Treponema sp.]|jgi:chromosome segregation ATPase|nr:hypothetical protein [Treponema sp.]
MAFMDERKVKIRELEGKNNSNLEANKRLLQGLGESLIQRQGEDDTLPGDSGGILAEYRGLQKEIADSNAAIENLQAESLTLKNLDSEIHAKESESSGLAKEFGDACVMLGKSLLASRLADEPYHQQEGSILAKISEQEQKVSELEEREGGVLSWIGKSAQIAVAKALLLKHRSALQKVYKGAGEQFFSERPNEVLSGEPADAAIAGEEIKERISVLEDEITSLKKERRVITDSFGVEGAPAKRIQTHQKNITDTEKKFSALFLQLGSFAAKSEGAGELSSFLTAEDNAVLERASYMLSAIAENEVKIQKLKAEINIDVSVAEIEKTKKAISNQRQKIDSANAEIADLEKHIRDEEEVIAELKAFIKGNE